MAYEKKEILLWQNPTTPEFIRGLLEKNQVVLTSTDTVLGLLAPVTRTGHEQLDLIKGRAKKPYVILIGSVAFLTEFIDQVPGFHIEKLVTYCWPGPLTLVFAAKSSLPDYMKGADGTIAIRVPDHDQLRYVAAQFHGLFSTSANRAQQPVATTIADVDPQILNRVAACVDDQDGVKKELASTILDCSTGVIRIVRRGSYPIDTLQEIAGVKFS